MFKKIILYTLLFTLSYNLKDLIIKFSKKNINEEININNEEQLKEEDEIKKKFSKKKKTVIKEETSLVVYKPKKVSKCNLKDVYNNFFNKVPVNINKDIDIQYAEKFNVINKSKIILSEKKNNILLEEENNFIIYNFECLDDKYYKIKFNMNSEGMNNIKFVITNNKKKFIHNVNHNVNQNLDEDTIYDYGFTLNYNHFNMDDSIYIYIFFYNNLNKDIKINDLSIEIIENLVENKIYESIIIFNVNEKNNPLFLKVGNILDYDDYEKDTGVFFM